MIPAQRPASRGGRKPLYGEGHLLTRKLNVRVSEPEHEKLLALGGSSWIRAQIKGTRKASKLVPSAGSEPKVTRFQARLTPEEVRRFHQLGGSRWLRLRLSKTDNAHNLKH